jgi:hypothetical protein
MVESLEPDTDILAVHFFSRPSWPGIVPGHPRQFTGFLPSLSGRLT